MKVLICGESGVFCNELIARLKKEKHDIFVITGTEKTEKGKNKKAGYQVYDFGYESKNIRSIMSNVKPDYAVILGACDTKFLWSEEEKTAVEYLASMTNLIKSAKDGGVQNVIYCSSLGVYGGQNISEINTNTPMSPTTATMQAFAQVENVCREQSKASGFNASVIKYPEIYGDNNTNSYNICQSIMNSCLFGKKVTIMPEKEHRIIYVKDAVDALVRVLEKGARAVDCFVPGMVATEKRIFEEAKLACSKKDMGVSEIAPAGSVKALSVTEADSREYGFSTKYDLNEGLAELYKLTERERLSKVKSVKKKGKMAEGVIKTLETVVSFIIVTLLIYVTKGTWLESIVDLYLIYVVIVAATYGFAQGSLATILVLLAKAGEIFTTGKAFEFSNFISVPQVFIIGAIVGYMYDKHKRKNAELEEDKEYYQSELVDMTRIYDGNRYMKDIYESRIVNYENSMVKIYDAYNQMDHWEPQRVVFNAVDVVKELMDIEDVAIYIAGKNPSYMRLMASSTEKARVLGKSIKIDSSLFMKDAIDDKAVFRSRDLDSSTPTYGCGVYGTKGLTAIVMLWTDDLSKVNLYEANMLALVCKLMESAMNHAVTYWNDVADHFIEGTNILVRDKFKTMEEICKEGAKENKIVYSTLKIPGSEIERGGMETCKKITSCVRDTDIVGEKDGDVYILLMNTNSNETKFVLERFANAGIQVVAQ